MTCPEGLRECGVTTELLGDFKRSGDAQDLRRAMCQTARGPELIVATLTEGQDWSASEFESLRERCREYVAQGKDIQERINILDLESESAGPSGRQSGRGQRKERTGDDDGDGREREAGHPRASRQVADSPGRRAAERRDGAISGRRSRSTRTRQNVRDPTLPGRHWAVPRISHKRLGSGREEGEWL